MHEIIFECTIYYFSMVRIRYKKKTDRDKEAGTRRNHNQQLYGKNLRGHKIYIVIQFPFLKCNKAKNETKVHGTWWCWIPRRGLLVQTQYAFVRSFGALAIVFAKRERLFNGPLVKVVAAATTAVSAVDFVVSRRSQLNAGNLFDAIVIFRFPKKPVRLLWGVARSFYISLFTRSAAAPYVTTTGLREVDLSEVVARAIKTHNRNQRRV